MTLVEMLIVLAIVGIATGAVALGIGSATRGNSVETEARQLAARLRLAADDAMVSDRRLVFVHDAGSYAFVAVDDAGRPQDAGGESFARHDLPSGVTLDTGSDAAPVPIGVDGGASPIAARLAGPGRSWTVDYDGLNVVVAPEGAS